MIRSYDTLKYYTLSICVFGVPVTDGEQVNLIYLR